MNALLVLVTVHSPISTLALRLGGAYKGFDFHADFSGGAGYTWFQNYETRWAFQGNGNLNAILKTGGTMPGSI
jgi:hypothetical protein